MHSPSANSAPETGAIRSGDHAAFDRLYDRFSPRVRGYLLRLTGSHADADDLTQETFLAAFHGRASFGGRGGATPVAWLLGIAWRRWRDTGRSLSSRDKTAVYDEGSALTDGGTAGQTADPARQVIAALTMEAALHRLTEPERDCLLLTAVEGLTYAETARITGEPIGTVKWRVHRATRSLRQLLDAGDERAAQGDMR